MITVKNSLVDLFGNEETTCELQIHESLNCNGRNFDGSPRGDYIDCRFMPFHTKVWKIVME